MSTTRPSNQSRAEDLDYYDSTAFAIRTTLENLTKPNTLPVSVIQSSADAAMLASSNLAIAQAVRDLTEVLARDHGDPMVVKLDTAVPVPVVNAAATSAAAASKRTGPAPMTTGGPAKIPADGKP